MSRTRHRIRVTATAILILIVVIALATAAYFIFFNLGNISSSPLPIPMVSVARNWAGYEVATNFLTPSSAVQNVSASWVVPSVKNSDTNAFSSVWVGIGGQFDHTLIQVGTEQDAQNGSAKYYAWYKLLPSNAVTINSIQVSPGDQISASISTVNSNSNTWAISLQDVTNNQKFQSNFNYNSQQLTAEWIVERPYFNNALAALANFGSVTFTNCQANLSGETGGITNFSYDSVILDPEIINNHSVQIVSVSRPSNGGTQFTVDYVST